MSKHFPLPLSTLLGFPPFASLLLHRYEYTDGDDAARVLWNSKYFFLPSRCYLFFVAMSAKGYAKSMRGLCSVYFADSVQLVHAGDARAKKKKLSWMQILAVFLHEFRFILMAMDWTVFLLICLLHLHSSTTCLVDKEAPACLPSHLCLRLSHLSDPQVLRWADFALTHTARLVPSRETAWWGATRHRTSRRLHKRGCVQWRFPVELPKNAAQNIRKSVARER